MVQIPTKQATLFCVSF